MIHSSTSMNEHTGVAGSPSRWSCGASHQRRGEGRPVRGGPGATAAVEGAGGAGVGAALAEPVAPGDASRGDDDGAAVGASSETEVDPTPVVGGDGLAAAVAADEVLAAAVGWSVVHAGASTERSSPVDAWRSTRRRYPTNRPCRPRRGCRRRRGRRRPVSRCAELCRRSGAHVALRSTGSRATARIRRRAGPTSTWPSRC